MILMGKFIPDRDYVNEIETEKKIRDTFAEYAEHIHQFEIKDNKAAGVRARRCLLELYPLLKQRRLEILERKKTLGWHEHPSWSESDAS